MRVLSVVVLAYLAIAGHPQASAQQPAQKVKVGVIGPFTGPSADFGTPMLNGIQHAFDEINAGGGFLGRPIELVVRDDKADPDVGKRMAEELRAEGVVATLGFCNTGVAMKALPVFQDNQMPLIVPCSTGTPVTSAYPAATSYIFRNAPRDAIQAPFVVDDILKRGLDRVAIFADTSGYGEAGLKDVEAALAERKLKPAYVSRFPLGATDLTEELKAARAAGANVVFSYTVGPENAAIARGRSAIGWKVQQVGAWPLSFPFFIEGGKEPADGALMAQSFIAEPSNERRSSFLTGYARKFKVNRIPVPMAAAQGYDAAYLLLYAMFGVRNGDLSGPSMKSALENISRTYYGVVATYDRPFSAQDKDALTSNMLVMGMVRGGAVTFAYPEDARRNLFVQRKR